MINLTLSTLRDSNRLFKIEDIALIIDGKKKREIGYFIPATLKKEFETFVKQKEQEKRLKLLKRVAKASKKDKISDGAVSDGIE